jgi:hypothetical protein
MEYITRLTPNFLCWERPSGPDGKCNGNLFEAEWKFGWEEWLLRDFHFNRDNFDFRCSGFVEAFNGSRAEKLLATLHFYTRVGLNSQGITPGNYYVGRIDNIKTGLRNGLSVNQISADLQAVGINRFPAPPLWNVQFLVKDVHILCSKDFILCPIQLAQGQGRFGLYDLEQHQNLKKQINKYTK